MPSGKVSELGKSFGFDCASVKKCSGKEKSGIAAAAHKAVKSVLKANQWTLVLEVFQDLVLLLVWIQTLRRVQQDGKLPFVPEEEEFIMGVSKYGIKVTSLDQCNVLHRHALYLIVRMVCYDDGLGAGKSLLALKTTDSNSEEYNLWIYQCNSLEQAQAVCKVLSAAFDSVLTSEKS